MSLFKNFDPDKSRIEASRKKINEHPEVIRVKGYFPRSDSLDENINILTEEEQALVDQLKEIQRKRKELEEEKKNRIPVSISFRSCERDTITFTFTGGNKVFRELINQYSGYIYGENTVSIHIDKYLELEEVLKEQFPEIKIINFEPIHEPYWKIKGADKNIVVQPNPITNYGGYYKRLRKEDNVEEDLLNIPGCYRKDKIFTIPYAEGWRLYSIHPEVKTRLCEWVEEELIDRIRIEFEKRLRVKEIHTAEDSTVDVLFPNSPNFKSRPHQRVAWEFSELVDHKSLVVFSTGTGKTAIGIGDILRTDSQRNLIMCPGSLRLNWYNHILKHTGEEPLILAGRVPTKLDKKYLLLNSPKWVIINYEILRTKIAKENEKDDIFKDEHFFPWVDLINLYDPEYAIVDETHYMNNPSASQSQAVRQIDAPKKMALGATPIMNKPGELWSVLNWLRPEQFKYYETFLNDYGFDRSITDYQAKKLRSLLETIMIKRSRADISKNLPPINRIVETFEMSDRARKIYNKILMGIYEEFAVFDHRGQGGQQREFTHILPKLNAMIKVCAADKVRVTVEQAINIRDNMDVDEKHNGIIIFTHFKGTCNTIARMLGHEAVSLVDRTDSGFKTLDMPERMKVVEEFNTDPRIRFLVATQGSAREGLDMVRGSVVLFNDLFWNPGRHIQCEGRPFYREVDLHGGDSYYLQFTDSIEEWITELNGIKENTIEKIIEGKGMGVNITNEIVERLREMFRKRTRG